jgi:hypothetical protein
MRIFSIAISLWVFTVALAGCQSSDPHAASSSSSPVPSPSSSTPGASPSPIALKSKIDPCALLTSDELKAVQSEALQTTLPSEREYGEYLIAQCYYQLPTITNSVVVNVTTPKEAGSLLKNFGEARAPKLDVERNPKKRNRARKKSPELARTHIGKPAELPAPCTS